MLVLTRKTNESLMIGEDIEIVVLQVKGKNVKLGIKAPKDYSVYRREIYEQIREQNKMASMTSIDSFGILEGILIKENKPS
ncbi:MAG: carbon storage regulator CsrA, partial [Candidatus Eremiobacterota bacterium]